MAIEFSGLDTLIQKLDEASKKAPQVKSKFLAQEGELLRGRTVNLTPVDTGRLRADWKRSSVQGNKVAVFNNTEYAGHVEYGHRVKVHGRYTGGFVPGRHMLRDAMEETKKNFPQDASDILKGILS